jgi:hypothetical protein
VILMAEELCDSVISGRGGEGRPDDVIPGSGDGVEGVGWWRHGLGGVEQGARNFGSLMASKSKSSGYGLKTRRLGVL